jgi:hypothetical protein
MEPKEQPKIVAAPRVVGAPLRVTEAISSLGAVTRNDGTQRPNVFSSEMVPAACVPWLVRCIMHHLHHPVEDNYCVRDFCGVGVFGFLAPQLPVRTSNDA